MGPETVAIPQHFGSELLSQVFSHRGLVQWSATKDQIMASSLAVAVSAVPADRGPDSLLCRTGCPFLPPCHSFTFLITPSELYAPI